MTRVTVIIPTFNRAAYLEEAIASAASQDCADAVVVVADNASEDGTRDVVGHAIERYGTDRVEYVRRDTNIGWVANFNRAFSDVQTEFALVLGDDDRLLPGALTRAVTALDHAPGVGFVHSAFETIDEHGATVDTATDWTKGLTEDTLEPGPVFIERTIPWMTRVFTHSVLIRHTAFPDVMWDPADGLSPDYFVWLRIALDWDVQYLATPGAQRRVHLGALSNALGVRQRRRLPRGTGRGAHAARRQAPFHRHLREPSRRPEGIAPGRVPRQSARSGGVQPWRCRSFARRGPPLTRPYRSVATRGGR